MNVLIAGGLMVMIVGGFLMLYNGSIQQEVEINKPNYRGIFILYDSRTWDTLDYGKTFVGVNG